MPRALTLRRAGASVLWAFGVLGSLGSLRAAAPAPHPELDVERYRFELRLGDQDDVLRGRAEISLRWLRDGVERLRLDLDDTGADDGSGADGTADDGTDGTGEAEDAGDRVAPSTNGHRRGMSVVRVALLGAAGAEPPRALSFRHDNDVLTVDLPAPSRVGEAATIEVVYHGVPRDGLIISENRYGERTFFGDNWPDRAHRWLPCVDHPSDKALVEFSVTAPATYQVVANGRLVEETDLEQGLRRTEWRSEAPIATKLMVIGVARFAVQQLGEIEGVALSSWLFPHDRAAGFADYARAERVLRVLASRLGEFPYAKLANVQSKTRYGGMENASAIFYSERSVTGEGRSEPLLAHEIAHQWFGDAVTETDWPHLWISEGFATYLAAHYLELTRGVDTLRQRMRADRERVVAYQRQHPVPVVRTEYQHPSELLDVLTYRKGAWVLHMLRRELGERAFWEGVAEIVERYRHGNADTEAVRAAFELVSGRDLGWFFEQWLERPDLPRLATDWRWRPGPPGGEGTLEIEVIQKQTGPPYRLQLELETGDEAGSVVTIALGEREQTVLVPAVGPPERVTVDPSVWLLFEAATRQGSGGAGG